MTSSSEGGGTTPEGDANRPLIRLSEPLPPVDPCEGMSGTSTGAERKGLDPKLTWLPGWLNMEANTECTFSFEFGIISKR